MSYFNIESPTDPSEKAFLRLLIHALIGCCSFVVFFSVWFLVIQASEFLYLAIPTLNEKIPFYAFFPTYGLIFGFTYSALTLARNKFLNSNMHKFYSHNIVLGLLSGATLSLLNYILIHVYYGYDASSTPANIVSLFNTYALSAKTYGIFAYLVFGLLAGAIIGHIKKLQEAGAHQTSG